MDDLKMVVREVRRQLVDRLGAHLQALYLFGSAARGQYVSGRSDVDLLLIVDPNMRLPSARDAFRPLFEQYASILGHGPMLATVEDLALHLALFPSLHRALSQEGLCLHGDPVLKRLPPPSSPDLVDEAAYVAARAITYATALTPKAIPVERFQGLARHLDRLTRRVAEIQPRDALSPPDAMVALHAQLRELAPTMPQFNWGGSPPQGDLPDLLPGCLAFYQRDKHLITVLERVDEEVFANVDWGEVAEAAEEAGADFALATPWQLRLAASRVWVDSLFFNGFEHMWGADILGDLEADEEKLLRRLAQLASEQRVEKIPVIYLMAEDDGISKLIHDTQNVLLNAGLRAELFTRLTGRTFELAEWTPPGREVPQPERVAAAWDRWREITAYYAGLWRQMSI
jgi:predicted nucleotidyltransferase